MNQRKKKIYYLTPPETLLSEHYYRRLWLAVRNLGIPRREWLDVLADRLRDNDGCIMDEDGNEYEFPFVDDIFGDDPSMRWAGYYLLADESGTTPKTKSRKIERLQLLDLYFKVHLPEIAKRFST